MKIEVDNETFEKVNMIVPVYQKENNKSHWLFLYFDPGTTNYNHGDYWDYIAIEYNPFKSHIRITK